ncbi:hypothetical protein BDV19DRAFT_383005 [Aspergillus venezuelensis]
MALLSQESLEIVVAAHARMLDALNIDYALMGRAATCFLSPDTSRRTEDVDMVIHGIGQFGHTIPAYKLRHPGVPPQLVGLEVATRQTLNINGQAIKVFGPEWILRELILAQYQRQGSGKEATDIRDIAFITHFFLTLYLVGPRCRSDSGRHCRSALG